MQNTQNTQNTPPPPNATAGQSAQQTELDRLRADILAFFPTVADLLDEEDASTRRRVLAESRERLASDEYYVVVCGEFRRGKSSLLNALVRRRKLFPVAVDVTTAIVATLRWGPTERARVWPLPDPNRPDSRPAPFEVPLAEVRRYATEQENPDNVKRVDRIEMEAPFAPLRSGLVLVDTPGVGSVNPAHTAATRSVLPRADAVLFVGSAVEPLSTVELDFLRYTLERCPVIVTAVTMIDKVVDPDPVVAQARARIARVSQVPPEDLVVVGVSAFRRWAAEEEEDPVLAADSGFPELESALWEGLAETCGRAALRIALDRLDETLEEIAAPLTNEAAALQSGEALAEVEKEILRTQETLTALRSQSSRWRRELQDDLEQAVRPVRGRLTAAMDAAREAFRRGCEDERAAKEPERLVRAATLALLEASDRAVKELESAVLEVAQRYGSLASVPLTAQVAAPAVPKLSTPSLSGLGEESAGTAGKGGWKRSRIAWSSGEAGSGMGLAAGAVIGLVIPVIGPWIGGFVGSLIGQFAGMIGGSRQDRADEEARAARERTRRLKESVLPVLDSGRRQVEQEFNGHIRDSSRALANALEDQLAAQAETMAGTVRRLQEVRRSTARERAERLPVVRRRLAALDPVRRRSQDLRRRVARLGATPPSDGPAPA
ncbi:dynamin family protein [Streptomyces sp. NBC_01275]|uniref:dynamin family protein n=1 Tax=Streptomyces sp. NBC_01275 TaxID=2903807 RepID=UPI0022533C08|nr:dynamin family protein [Streptomyces sp. NBC_01275]MCX4762010.1 dynamin family protein [Streptomyces sp. NBC_01275]